MKASEISTKRAYLARHIAQTFKVEADLKRYRNVCKKYSLTVVLRAFAEAKSVPQPEIRKSRPALFFYLVKKYSHERRNPHRN